ncbi:Hypothetical protein C900_03782 [Fulvivirga imtechensis AK7]|uniref:DUF2851 domain-containing protein n=1 Tax=Fulvivirga imtechensis AK7 TaxID=1237149 RepID=L8JQE4_9BACT|nr:DUF2851 family protein [Fulvivirga imtechensis]ELR70428.1 Hypothetical protein C900_03782 [Fulvivirga imtechensis AK7]
MQEAFLHFIWQYQYFDKRALITSEGASVNIIHPGYFNTDAGPDFKEARIRIGEMEWRGHVELHVHSSDWSVHAHQYDKAYNNVILHVVWKNNQEARRQDETVLPVVELQGLVSEEMIFSYKKLLNSPYNIPCEKQLHNISDITWISTLDKILMERLSAKANSVNELLSDNKQDWEETAYQLLAKNFGFKVNSEPFLHLARVLPYKILKKHADNGIQVEALVFGQAGFLDEDPVDGYQSQLAKEYAFLKHKYQMQEGLSVVQWRFLRLRPANFPTVRLAQFAGMIHHIHPLFKSLLETESVKDLRKLLIVEQSQYWSEHYQFGKSSGKKMASLGMSSVENIGINTIAPLLVAYGQYTDDASFIDKAVALLQSIKAEKNKITNYWSDLGVKNSSAFDSQALIQLYNEYCIKHRCLSCNIGVSLIHKS